jgi:RNA polymerase sigma factor (sigma-70 family)
MQIIPGFRQPFGPAPRILCYYRTSSQIPLENLAHIIEGCKRREHKYQRMIYENFYGYALKTVFRYIYRYERAVDVVNDGFVKLFSHFDQFKCADAVHIERMLMGWIRRIMINTAIDELRKNSLLPEIGGIPDHVWDVPDNSQKADQLVMYKELVSYVKELPPAYRAVFNLFVIDGYSHYEIADLLGVSVGTSKSNLSRARVLLQKFLKKSEEIEA